MIHSPSASTKALWSLLNNYKGMLPGLNRLLKRADDVMLGMTRQAKETEGDRRSEEPARSFQKRECEEMLSFCIIA